MASTVLMVLCLVVACMVVAAPYSEAITCGQVASSVAPCIGYLKRGGPVPPTCCVGVRRINNAAKSTHDHQTVCGCLKKVYASNPGIVVTNGYSIPHKCGFSIPYKVSPTTDCSKIH